MLGLEDNSFPVRWDNFGVIFVSRLKNKHRRSTKFPSNGSSVLLAAAIAEEPVASVYLCTLNANQFQPKKPRHKCNHNFGVHDNLNQKSIAWTLKMQLPYFKTSWNISWVISQMVFVGRILEGLGWKKPMTSPLGSFCTRNLEPFQAQLGPF